MNTIKFKQTFIALILASSFPALADQAGPKNREAREPEAATGFTLKKEKISEKYMVVAANPHASKAGQLMLQQGGSAIDAAIAAQLVLTLVEPQSSGIGGGAFILHYDRQNDYLTTFDGRETAPKKADHKLFLDKEGKPVRWIEAVVGGRSVGVPGIIHSMKQAHDKYGVLKWKQLFKPAIDLASKGFKVSPRLHMLLKKEFNPGLTKLSPAKDYFYPNGKALEVGALVKNPELAKLYREIAEYGPKAFYEGKYAEDMVKAVQKSEIAPGHLSMSDLANYQSKERHPVCTSYHDYKVCSMAPPSSGGLTVLQILKLLEGKKLAQYKPNDPQAVHLFTQASRLAFADRNFYIADPDFVDVPTQGLLNPVYIKSRAELIGERDNQNVPVGDPTKGKLTYAQDNSYELPSTTHLSIVDSKGNAVSMTSSIEMGFGSTVMVNGYLLNNQLTDFSLAPKIGGNWVANRVEPNKRPRSSMAPVMVFNKDGSLKLVVGSPGGSRIINYVAQTVIGVLDWGLTPQQAINLPRVTNRNKYTTLEKGTDLKAIKPWLESKGHKVRISDLNSGIHAIEIKEGLLFGGADPRREGVALGESSE
ncbi:gamma-glutamyltransferase [Pseudoalteromonas luteoviolacea]|uniref:Glutathione hydrolase proenzyme n=1 Tax=Pseudoalteromonas luteoviolacea S4054 TaxID=1129367 RepID=A0A0F6AEQ7_9GAMM|nr:gamma-glutamyltransferase [Pseudoalteromonas luteoviolacea]AOT08210.1 gamma-glutamyltransferase [Pseudoalteromonas luteoviolacea]AOT13127.1 gamma-glutamyltransferase [Pseudoalteromonas luteoviolacea]AOT18039.1 gamma-glutamyltransferase [Pseudoalteromonas luteoviolacea]KKE84685.1 gamma-glutamyltransferase [Pseudoalteromonas luteoviolacea S4054]KZN74434.1 gamma-glutamyltransferase [Pseudoalteromonas luteoviolacea S4047-1]